MNLINTCDLVITVAYFSIPIQIWVSLWKSPPHRKIPLKLVVTLVLFGLFIFLCGAGHLMRYLGQGQTKSFLYINVATALVSLITALYCIPLIPSMFSLLDESLNKLTNESKESKSKLFTFMAFLCHEIRNPLFAITSSAEFLNDTDLQPDQAEEVSSIADSSLLMLRLVNDVLDLSKLESGKLELESREFDFHSLLRRLVDNMDRQIERKHRRGNGNNNVQLLFELNHREVPQYIIGDSCRILQIIYNLLSNSAKFCSTGSIELKVRLANDDEERKEQQAAREAGAHTVTMSRDQPFSLLLSSSSSTTSEHHYKEEEEEEEEATTTKEEEQQQNDCSADEDDDDDDDEEKNPLFSLALLGESSSSTIDLEAGRGEDGGSGGATNNPNESIMVLSISVRDTGIGIPTERLKNIFEPYTQAKLSDYRQHGGTGLGLSIISSLIKTMGGTISVSSREGEGCRFHLQIPVRVPLHPTTFDNDDEIDHHADEQQQQQQRGASGATTIIPSTTGRGTRKQRNSISDSENTNSDFLDSEARRLPVFDEDDSETSLGMCSPTRSSTLWQANNGVLPLPSPRLKGNIDPIPSTTTGGALFPLIPQDSTKNKKKMLMDESSSGTSSTLDLSDDKISLSGNNGEQNSPAASSARHARTLLSPPPPPPLPSFDFPSRSNMVLVVDDNAVNRKILGKMLNTYKLEYETACNGQEAVDVLLNSISSSSRNHDNAAEDDMSSQFGLVFMDISMPVMDGNEAIRRIRKANISVPIVALSANVLSQERDRTIRLGADEFHTKPILRSDLHRLCTRYLLAQETTGTNRQTHF